MRNKRTFEVQVVTDPYEALRRAIYGPGVLEACAESVGVSHQTLSKQVNEIDGCGLSLRRAVALEQFIDTDALAECFAARRGGIFLKLKSVSGTLPELAAGWSKLLKEQAEAAAAFSDAVADGKVTAAEVNRFEAELRDVAVAGQHLVLAARARIVEPKA